VTPEEPQSPPPTRRRVQASPPKTETEGRAGCLITGALLGIIVGATFAFYGLPPILKHFYGEQHVAAGQPYTGDAKTLRVVSAGVQTQGGGGTLFVVELAVETNKTWTLKASDVSLQFPGGGDWQEAESIASADGLHPGPVFEFRPADLATEVRLRVLFKPGAADAPTYLHLADPLIRFALAPADAPK
jgi:hypothetical protein